MFPLERIIHPVRTRQYLSSSPDNDFYARQRLPHFPIFSKSQNPVNHQNALRKKYLRKIIFFWLFSPHLTIRYHRYISDYVSTCTYEFVSSCAYLQYDFCVVCGLLGVLISLCLA